MCNNGVTCCPTKTTVTGPRIRIRIGSRIGSQGLNVTYSTERPSSAKTVRLRSTFLFAVVQEQREAKMVHCMGCTRRIIQFVLIGVNIFVAVSGTVLQGAIAVHVMAIDYERRPACIGVHTSW